MKIYFIFSLCSVLVKVIVCIGINMVKCLNVKNLQGYHLYLNSVIMAAILSKKNVLQSKKNVLWRNMQYTVKPVWESSHLFLGNRTIGTDRLKQIAYQSITNQWFSLILPWNQVNICHFSFFCSVREACKWGYIFFFLVAAKYNPSSGNQNKTSSITYFSVKSKNKSQCTVTVVCAAHSSYTGCANMR